jgi:outer membrane receptor protein involved in Fe transport
MDLGSPRTIRQGGFSALLIIIALCFSSTAARAAGPTILFNIPAGDAQKTLQQFYSQSRIEMLYLTDMVRGTKTNAVTGDLEASNALAQMLKGTGLEYSFEEDYSFVSITPRVREPMGSAAPIVAVTAATMSEVHDQLRPLQDALGNDIKIAEVVVTGTLIHGVLDIVSPVEFVTKREMKKSAYATVQDALAALPVNFGGGPSEDFSTVGNFGKGSSVNLRGLGAGATLVLVNGYRQPYSGTEGDFVDLSNIASSIVDHIEVLPDGASALYGSDAIAGVVNIITRKDLDGAETQVRMGAGPGGGDEKLLSQLFGKKWDTGSVLFSYQFLQRTSLDAASRAYAASADKRSLGGTDHRSTRSNPGNLLDPLTFLPSLAIPSDQDGSALSAADLIRGSANLQNQYTDVQLLPDRRTHSASLSGIKKLGDHIELSAEGRATDRRLTQDYIAVDRVLFVPSTNPFSPYKGVRSAIVSYSFLDDLGPRRFDARAQNFSGSFGAQANVGASWKTKLSASYGRETIDFRGYNEVNSTALRAALADSKPETAFNPFGDGSFTNPKTIESIKSVQREYARSSITSANFVADGTAFDLPTGPLKLAVGSEWRHEQLARGAVTRRSFDRSIQSAYAELAVPIVGQPDDVHALPRLELSLAGRFESYSDFGHSSDPKVGLRWTPTSSLKLRTSWGTSFKAPKLADVYDLSNNSAGLASLPDARTSTGSTLVVAIEGNNPDLTQETASTWTAGVDFAPPMIDGLKLSLTYYDIDYNNRILVPAASSPSEILLQEDQWSSVIHRNPTQDEINVACTAAPLFGVTLSQCESAPIAAIVDFRVRNMASTRVRGVDLKLDQSVHTRLGRFDFGLNGGYILSFLQASSSSSPTTDVVNTVGNPLAFRMRGIAEWSQRDFDDSGFGASAALDRFGGYRDPDSAVAYGVAPFTTLDLRLSYRTPKGNSAFDGLEFGLNASNVFNVAPPFVDDAAGYDVVNADPYGRVISLNIQKSW